MNGLTKSVENFKSLIFKDILLNSLTVKDVYMRPREGALFSGKAFVYAAVKKIYVLQITGVHLNFNFII